MLLELSGSMSSDVSEPGRGWCGEGWVCAGAGGVVLGMWGGGGESRFGGEGGAVESVPDLERGVAV